MQPPQNMRIETVSFENLNSLAGKFSIDLTHPSLTDTGIFVITGPTGAGKTTILDAVCFALYRRTSRLSSISANSNELMTHGMPDCCAEVRFESRGEHYCVRTAQRRARGQNPYAAAESELYRVKPDGKRELLENRARSVAAAVERITGLSYESFQRCMMLAQGDFAAFLKADEKERANVLEMLTGTEIYKRIGEQVQQKCSDAKQRLDALQARETLGEEERRQMETRRSETQQRLETLLAEMEQLKKKMDWLDSVQKARESLALQQQKLAEAEQRQLEFAGESAGRLRLLKAWEKVKPAFLLAEEREKSWAGARQRLAALEQELEQVSARWRELRPEEPEQHLTRLREELVPMEKAVETARQDYTHKAAQKKTAEASLAAAEKECAEARQAAAAAETQLAAAEEELRQLQDARELPEVLGRARSLLADWAGDAHAADTLPSAELLQQRKDMHGDELSTLLAGDTEAAMQRRLTLSEELVRAQKRFGEARDRRAGAEVAKGTAELQLQSLPSVEEAEKELEDLREALERERSLADLEKKLSDLRLSLQRGEFESCPLCGGRDFSHLPQVPPTDIDKARSAVNRADKKLENLRAEHAAASEELTKCKTAWENATTQERACLQELQQRAQACGYAEVPENPEMELATAKYRWERVQELGKLLKEDEALLACRAKQDAFLQALGSLCPQPPQSPQAGQAALQSLSDRLHRYQTAMKQEKNAREASAAVKATLSAKSEQVLRQTEALKAAALAETQAAEQLRTAQEQLREQWGDTRAVEAIEQTNRLISLLKERSKQAEATERAEQEASAALAAEYTAQQENGFEHREAFRAVQPAAGERETLEKQDRELSEAVVGAGGAVGQAQEHLDTLLATPMTEEPRETLQEQSDTKAQEQKDLDKERTELIALLGVDDAARADNAELEAKRRELQTDAEHWNLLYELLGNSKEGFKRYAQQITFRMLLDSANDQLRKLNNRYTLLPGPDNLSIYVRDCYLDDEAGRDSANLSGGESFIVSLALALGLSHMVGSTGFDTLFLDEGFGTLDADALEKVLDCLESLRASGKLIGIISHVDRLRERISQNIEVCRRSDAPGFSRLAPHPAVSCEPAVIRVPQPEVDLPGLISAFVASRQGGVQENVIREHVAAYLGRVRLRTVLADMVNQGILRKEGRIYTGWKEEAWASPDAVSACQEGEEGVE